MSSSPLEGPGLLRHTFRNPDGSWQPVFGLIETQEQNDPGAFSAVSCAGLGDQLHVVGSAGGQLWHTFRNPDGSWQPVFGLIESQERNDPGAFSAVSCAWMFGGSGFQVVDQLHVVGIAGGQLWDTFRTPLGWQPIFGLIESQEQNDPGAFSDVSCSPVGNQLHVVGVAGGQLWHTFRNPDGSWQPVFGLIESQEQNNPGAFSAISCSQQGDQLQVVGIA